MIWYQYLIEIVRIDIPLRVSLMYQYQVLPREEGLEQFLRILLFLEMKPKMNLYFELGLPNIEYGVFFFNAYCFGDN